MKRTEHGEQAAFFDWVLRNQTRLPQLECLYAIPNGAATARTGTRNADGSWNWSKGSRQALKLKAEGLRPGMPDIHLPVSGYGSNSEYKGLWLEFKRPGNKPSDDQVRMAKILRFRGHRVEVVFTAEQAINLVEEYLCVPPRERTQHFG